MVKTHTQWFCQQARMMAKRRMLDLFCGTGSVGDVFRDAGFDVVSLDADNRWKPTICVDVLDWDYRSAYPPGYFTAIAASPPCTEYSIALTTRPRDIETSNRIVKRTLSQLSGSDDDDTDNCTRNHCILCARTVDDGESPNRDAQGPECGPGHRLSGCGLLPVFQVGASFGNDKDAPTLDWGYRKATRIWGDPSILCLPLRPCLCDGYTCPNLVANTTQKRMKHRIQLGGDLRRSGVRNQIGRTKKFRVPSALIQYIMLSGTTTNVCD